MNHTRFAVLVFLAGIAAFSVTPANAAILGTVNISNHNTNLSDTGTLYGDGHPEGIYAYTGVYSWTNEGGTGLGTAVPNWGFCIELPQGAYNGPVDVLSLQDAPLPPLFGSPMGTNKANAIRELWGRDFDSSWITGQNRQMAEAFSAAIQEIVYETDLVWDVTGGAGFHVGADVEQAAIANTWLSQLNGNSAYFVNNLVAISTTDGQDYVVQTPEPATLSLLAFGAAALLRRRRS
jgi:hypothetical protein